MSFGEPIVLRERAELERVTHTTAATLGDVWSTVGATTKSSIHPEAKLIDRLQAGEEAAFNELVAEHSGDIYAVLVRLINDREEARDLTQETFIQAFRSIKTFRGHASLRTWLFRIAINLAHNRRRWWQRRRRDQTVSIDSSAHENSTATLAESLSDRTTADPEQQTLARERSRVLETALRGLKQPFREVVVLRDIEGLSYEDVGLALDISVGTVKSRLSRARQEMQRTLREHFK